MSKTRLVRLAGTTALALAPALLVFASGCSSNPSVGRAGLETKAGPVSPAMPWSSMVGFDKMGGFPELAAQLTPPDLTEEGSWARGSAEAEIIDTRTFDPQIQVNSFEGEPTLVKNLLPPHHRDRISREGPANDLVAGELTGEVTANPAALFPAIGATPWSPPDPTLAVGPNHIVETVNMDIAWYDKQGNLQFQSRLDSTGNPGFFETVGAGNFTFDPKCFYDQGSGRFFVLALEVYGSTQAWITFAVSDDSDPNGVWYKYRTDARVTVGGSTYWVDYPGFGFDNQAFYVNGNLFPLTGGGFGGVLFRSFDKSSVLNGGAAQWTDVRNGNAGSVQAAQHFGNNPAPYFIEHWTNTSLMMTAVKNPLTAPQIVTQQVTVPSYNTPTSGAPANGGTLDVLDGRMINAMWRDGKLVTAHGVKPQGSSTNQSRWYEIDTRGWPTSGQNPILLQSGNINGGAGVHTWFPAVYSNDAGDIGLVTAHSSSSQYASVQFTGRRAGDQAGTMGALQVAQNGSGAVSGRWGDYFDLALDPDGCTFWLVGEYYQPGGWRTWITSFNISDCCRVDLNGDGVVNTQDVLAFLNLWSAGDSQADWNDDGVVDTRDVLAFLNAYSAGC
jgi:hypothetical protein